MKKIITITLTAASMLILANSVFAVEYVPITAPDINKPNQSVSNPTNNNDINAPAMDISQPAIIPTDSSGILTPIEYDYGAPAGSVTNTGSVTDTNSSKPKTIGSSMTLKNPLKAESIQDIIFLAVDLAVYVGVAFAVLAIIFVGFKFVMAQGKPEEIKKAREWLFWIIIGLAILISAKVMVVIVKNTLISAGVVERGVFSPK